MIIIGLDHGNGALKGRSDLKEIESMSAYGRGDVFGTSIAKGKSKTHSVNTYTLNEFPDDVFTWGRDIWKANKLVHSFTKQDRYSSKAYKILSKIALSELANNGEKVVEVIVVTGAPSQEANTSASDTLKKLLSGEHMLTINNKRVIVDVKQVEVLPQPLGSVIDNYIDENGYVSDESFEEDYIGIIDIGSGTTDLDGVDSLNRQEDDSATLSLGFNDAYKRIAKWLVDKRPTDAENITWQQVEYQIRTNEDPDIFYISKRISEDISKVKQQSFEELAEDIIIKINQVWTSRSKFDKLILTGGGAEILAPYFKEWEPDIIVTKNPQMANARGFWKYGRAFLLEEDVQDEVATI